jgi:hypothetical protein
MKYKIENFAHQELNQQEYTDTNKIKDRIENKIEPFARPHVKLVEVKQENINPQIYDIFSKCCKV